MLRNMGALITLQSCKIRPHYQHNQPVVAGSPSQNAKLSSKQANKWKHHRCIFLHYRNLNARHFLKYIILCRDVTEYVGTSKHARRRVIFKVSGSISSSLSSARARAQQSPTSAVHLWSRYVGRSATHYQDSLRQLQKVSWQLTISA